MKAAFLISTALLLGAAPHEGVMVKSAADPFNLLRTQVKSLRQHQQQSARGATITAVITKLKGMLTASKTEGDKENGLYAKYKCYIDAQTQEKTESVGKETKKIALLTSKIEELSGDNGQLSIDVGQLKKDMDENEELRKKMQKLRDDEKKAYDEEKVDLTAAIASLGQAITALADIGADQNLADGEFGADHEQNMAGYEMPSASLLKVKTQVKQALLAASSVLKVGQRQKFEAFLQGVPGTYMAQSGEIIGILKNMKETFESNLEDATDTEKKALKSHTELDKTKKEEFDTMDKSYTQKQSDLAGNDSELTAKQGELETSTTQVADDQEFLEKLEPLGKDKAKEYEQRKVWRANEDMAISQAIGILDSDFAAKAFGKVDATAFLQLSATNSVEEQEEVTRRSASTLLQQAAYSMHSRRIAGIVALLNKKNPFTTVLTAIEGVKKSIAKEGQVDKAQNDWCTAERKEVNGNLDDKKAEIIALSTAIDKLDDTIDGATTGLKSMIQKSEDDMKTNGESQSSETKTRREENLLYQQETAECAEAEQIIIKAIKVLEKYYDDIAPGQSLVQEDPAPPDTWTAPFEGQKGADVISLLQSVHDNTVTEANNLHLSESEAQHKYEDAMKLLTDAESDLRDDLAKQKKQLADSELELQQKREDLDLTEKDEININQYLETIKPGCDFIMDNFAERETNRGKEVAALDTAISKLESTPTFASAKLAEKFKEECKETCLQSETDVKCKACSTHTSIPGYCVTHPDTPGC